jgi:hypothetical protein
MIESSLIYYQNRARALGARVLRALAAGCSGIVVAYRASDLGEVD